MKKYFQLFIHINLVCIFLISCFNPLIENNGTFTITIGDVTSRAAWLEPVSPEELVYTIKLFDNLGNIKYQKDDISYGQTTSFSVIPGFFQFYAEAKYKEEVIALGSTERTIVKGYNDPVFIKMHSLGTGTLEDPFIVFSVKTLSHVGKPTVDGFYDEWTLSAHYKQISNINLSSLLNWIPIGDIDEPFTGSYNGGGYTIENLKIDRDEDNQGLFGFINGDETLITNVALINVNISGKDNVGGLVGFYGGGIIENSYSTGTISGFDCVGGIVGIAYYPNIIRNCYSTSNVSGNRNAGGISGYSDGTIENCFATGIINGNDNIGGISGSVYERTRPVIIKNNVALNQCITAEQETNYIGRIAGLRNLCTLTGNYARDNIDIRYNVNTTGGLPYIPANSTDNKDGADITEDQWHSANWWRNAVNFDPAVWELVDGKLPVLKSAGGDQNPQVNPLNILSGLVTIDRAGDAVTVLVYIGTELIANYSGQENVGFQWLRNGNVIPGANNENFIPTEAGSYTVTVNMAGYNRKTSNVINVNSLGSGLIDDPFIVYNVETLSHVGKPSDDGFYKNWTVCAYYLQVSNIDLSSIGNWDPIGSVDEPFTGEYDGGVYTIEYLRIDLYASNLGLFGIVGTNALVTNVTLIDIYLRGADNIGGIIGLLYGGTVSNSSAAGEIYGWDGNSASIGGIVGNTENKATIENCYSAVNIGGSSNAAFGGVVGRLDGSIVKNSFSTGDITGNQSIGGIAGTVTNNSTVESCYSTGNIRGNQFTGGVAGYIIANSTVKNSYATGNVRGTGSVGGVAGRTQQSTSVIENCFSTANVRGTYNVGGVVGGGSAGRIENCAALSLNILSLNIDNSDTFKRIIGSNLSTSLINNHARSDMNIRYDTEEDWTGGTEYIPSNTTNENENPDGKNIDSTQWFSADWWENVAKFDPEIWILTDNKLPILADTGGEQNPIILE